MSRTYKHGIAKRFWNDYHKLHRLCPKGSYDKYQALEPNLAGYLFFSNMQVCAHLKRKYKLKDGRIPYEWYTDFNHNPGWFNRIFTTKRERIASTAWCKRAMKELWESDFFGTIPQEYRSAYYW